MASITNDNFIVNSQDFFALIPFCDFYAWDLEMTGIRAPDVPIPSAEHPLLKIPKDAFREKITAARRYDIIQIGVSLFFKDGSLVPDVVGARPTFNHNEALAVHRRSNGTEGTMTGPADEEEMAKVTRALNMKRLATDGIYGRLNPSLEKTLNAVDVMLRGNETDNEVIDAVIAMVENAVMIVRKEAAELLKLREDRGAVVRELIDAENLSHSDSSLVLEYYEDLRTQNTHFETFSELCLTVQRLTALQKGGATWKTLSERRALVPIEGRSRSNDDSVVDKSSSSSTFVASSPSAPQGYTVRAFSMYIFPNAELEPSRTVVLDAETCGIFLTNNSPMDFNHWIRQGTRYVTRETMSEIRLKTLFNYDIGGKPKPPAVPQGLTDDDTNVYLRVTKRFESGESSINPGFLSPDIFRHVANFATKMGYRKEGKTWTKGASLGAAVSSMPSPFDDAKSRKYGASCLIEALIDSRKPCVIHNGLSDLAFLLSKFHKDVPNSYSGFKALASACFPEIYDTRTLTTLECFSHVVNRGRMDKTYDNFVKAYGNQTMDVHVPTTGYELLAQAAHDAAADAFKTGKLFLIVQSALASEEKSTATGTFAFRNIVPVYESVFSVHFGMEKDCYVAKSSTTPVWILTTAERLYNRFDSICGKFSLDLGIPTTPMGGPGCDTILFSDSRAGVFSRPDSDGFEMLRVKVEMLMQKLFKSASIKRLGIEAVLQARAGEVIGYWPSPLLASN